MEYERSIFRVHQREMTGNICQGLILCFDLTMISMGFLNLFVLFTGHIIYKNGTGVISEALTEYVEYHKKNQDVFPSIYHNAQAPIPAALGGSSMLRSFVVLG